MKEPRSTSLRDQLPPGALRRGGYLLRRFRKNGTVFRGDYATWADALAATNGYSAPVILERTRLATREARDNPRAFERDSVLLPHPDYPLPVLAALLHAANCGDGRLRVLDFGGALGSSYFQLRPFLSHLRDVNWTVVEQPHYVECGQREFAGPKLHFQPTIASALAQGPVDVVFLSSVLQYLSAPHQLLDELLAMRSRFVVLDRTACHAARRDRLTVQLNPAAIYPASYPAWFFNEPNLLAHFRTGYREIFRFTSPDRVLHLGPRSYYQGYFFERNLVSPNDKP